MRARPAGWAHARTRPAAPDGRGAGLVEALLTVALAVWCLALAAPALDRGLRRARLRSAARDLALVFRQCRLAAALENVQFGIEFAAADGHAWSVYRDGNGNGIRRQDIASGIDVRVQGPHRVPDRHEGVAVRLPRLERIRRIPPERGWLADLDDPVQFGPTDIVSFSPHGSCSSGTVYLTAGRADLVAVRLYGATGRVRTWEYQAESTSWTER